MITLGQQIMIARKNKGLTQVELGAIVNLTDMQICNIEKDKNKPHLDNLKKLSDALGVKFDL